MRKRERHGRGTAGGEPARTLGYLVFGQGARMMARGASYRVVGIPGIVAALVVILAACTDFKKDFLCRPEGHCVNAPDGGTGFN
jgi:hypothetical protein